MRFTVELITTSGHENSDSATPLTHARRTRERKSQVGSSLLTSSDKTQLAHSWVFRRPTTVVTGQPVAERREQTDHRFTYECVPITQWPSFVTKHLFLSTSKTGDQYSYMYTYILPACKIKNGKMHYSFGQCMRTKKHNNVLLRNRLDLRIVAKRSAKGWFSSRKFTSTYTCRRWHLALIVKICAWLECVHCTASGRSGTSPRDSSHAVTLQSHRDRLPKLGTCAQIAAPERSRCSESQMCPHLANEPPIDPCCAQRVVPGSK